MSSMWEKELFTHAETPRVVKCGRLNKCGYEEHVKEICEDLLKIGLKISLAHLKTLMQQRMLI